MIPPFAKVLIANRGAVAARLIRALDGLGLASVAVYSEADAGLPYLAQAGQAIAIGPAQPSASYLNGARIIEAARQCGADAIHPGYGFLSENADFARAVQAAGLTFIGPSPRWIAQMGHKARARDFMRSRGLPVAAGSGLLGPDADIAAIAREIGFPVVAKPAAGGGGGGMIVAADEEALAKAVERARSIAARSFANSELYLERYLARPRHIEFQILADKHGAARHLFERDCSLQRRHQKVVEEAPAPALARGEIEIMAESVTAILAEIGYDGIGTVEMLRSADGDFAFLEMNTRLQVEHAVTEMVTGVDLVKAQIRAAAGERLAAVLPERIALEGAAVEARIYAEDPKTFLPSPGRLNRFRPCASGPRLRVETGYSEGCEVTPFYDPMLAKVIAHAPTRDAALDRLAEALASFEVEGVKTNIPFVLKALENGAFRGGEVHTGLAAEILT